jgi:hypothetical protein
VQLHQSVILISTTQSHPQTVSTMEIDTMWRSAFGDTSTRPVVYTSQEANEEGWRPLNDPQNFLLNLNTVNAQQLYAASSNNALALQEAQAEYSYLETRIKGIQAKEMTKTPQRLLSPDVFEERKEATLYGYKYDANRPAMLGGGFTHNRPGDEITDAEKHDVRLFQEPFEQGGFVPKEREFKSIKAKSKNPKNIDGWEPIVDDAGHRLIPRQQVHHDEYSITYVKRNIDANGEIVRPVSSDGSDVASGTQDKAVNRRLTRTRFNGKKVPATRDVSEAPSGGSTPRGRKRGTPAVEDSRDSTPNSKRQKVTAAPKDPVQPRPKHPNQYTKAKERAAKEQQKNDTVKDTAVPSPRPSTNSDAAVRTTWRDLTTKEKRERKWMNPELHAALKEDHLWLNDDRATADMWCAKLLANQHPTRSFAMYMKWGYWKENKLDKRPRNKTAADGSGPKGITKRQRTRKPGTAGSSGASTPASTPAVTPAPASSPDSASRDDGKLKRTATPDDKAIWTTKTTKRKATAGASSSKAQQVGRAAKKAVDSSASSPQTSSDDGDATSGDDTASPSSQDFGKKANFNRQKPKRPGLKKELSGSTIVVNNSGPAAAVSSATGTPPRRSQRKRRASG